MRYVLCFDPGDSISNGPSPSRWVYSKVIGVFPGAFRGRGSRDTVIWCLQYNFLSVVQNSPIPFCPRPTFSYPSSMEIHRSSSKCHRKSNISIITHRLRRLTQYWSVELDPCAISSYLGATGTIRERLDIKALTLLTLYIHIQMQCQSQDCIYECYGIIGARPVWYLFVLI